jgi:hypothetical protein
VAWVLSSAGGAAAWVGGAGVAGGGAVNPAHSGCPSAACTAVAVSAADPNATAAAATNIFLMVLTLQLFRLRSLAGILAQKRR